jgi:hypothetical protein
MIPTLGKRLLDLPRVLATVRPDAAILQAPAGARKHTHDRRPMCRIENLNREEETRS